MKVIAEKDYERIHNASLKILRETGIVFHSQKAIELLKNHGVKTEGNIAYFSEKDIEYALEVAPSSFEWKAKDENKSVIVGEDLLVQPNVGEVYIEDLDQGRRKATLDDYANIIKLCQASNVVNLNGGPPVDPADVGEEKKSLYMMYNVLKHTDKPMIGFCTNENNVIQTFKMFETTMEDSKILEKGHYLGVLVNPLSPLGFSGETIETITEYAKRNQVIMLAPCIMAGITGPIHLLGSSVLQNTEILAGLAYIQMVNPGTPVVYSVASTVGYMKSASFGSGSPEAMLINTPNIQMGLDFYHLPTRTMCGITHAKEVDAQAGYETMFSLMMGKLSGAHIFVQCMGVLDNLMVTSYEKFMIDEEAISRLKRVWEGIDTSDSALAVDAIQEVGHGGMYLTHPTTVSNFRKLWLPTVSNWDSYDDWEKGGKISVLRKANKRFKEILNNAPPSLISSETDNKLKSFLE